MPTNTTLIEKREELKRRLATGEYKTLVDIFLEWFGRLLWKITRRSKPLPIWLITIILSIAFALIGLVSILTAGDLALLLNLTRASGTLGILTVILAPAVSICSTVAMNQNIRRIFLLWHDEALDLTESTVSLDEFKDWLKKVCNWRMHLITIILGGLFSGSYTAGITTVRLGTFIGYGSTFMYVIAFMFGYAFLYLFLMLVLLSARLHRYELKLFAADPSSSQIVSRLSSVFDFVVYFVAIIAAYVTLGSAVLGVLLLASIIVVPFVWLPIIVMFISNHRSLSSIIRRAKWKTLNEIQVKVEKLQATENFEDKEKMDAINRLMDYHDRVKSTRNSAIDLGTTLNFINSLLLPLLAFLLGNLDLVLKLFVRKP